jgi:hypothetical protein
MPACLCRGGARSRVNPAYLRGDAGVGGWCCSAARRCARICRRMMRHARRRSEAAGAKLQVRVGWLAGTGREAAKDHLATARRGQPVGIQAASSPHRHSRRSFRSGGPPAPRMEAVNPNRTAPGTRTVSFDHLVGAGEQCWRDIETERLRSLEVDDQLELGGLLDGKVCGARLRGSRLPLNSVARVKKSPAEAGQDTKRVENTPA